MVKAAIPMEKPKESYMKYTNIRRKAKVTNILYVCLDQTDFLSFSIVMGLLLLQEIILWKLRQMIEMISLECKLIQMEGLKIIF